MLLYRVRSFETAILFQFLKIPEAWLVITFQIAQLDPYCGNEIFTWFSFFWLFLPHSLIQVLGVPSYLEAFSHQDTKAAVFIDGAQNLEHQASFYPLRHRCHPTCLVMYKTILITNFNISQ